MRRSVFVPVVVASLSIVGMGCGSGSFVDPPPRERPASVTGAIPVRAKELVLVLPGEPNDDLAVYETVARFEAGNLRAIYRLQQPKPSDPPKRQAEMIAQAAADGASVLLVVTNDSKETAAALAAVDQKKTPIVLLGRPIEGASGGTTPYTLVTSPKFDATAKKIAEALAEDGKKSGFAADAPVIFLKTEPPDESSTARDAALTDALKAVKHPVATTILVTNPPESVRPTLEAAVKQSPNVLAVVADNEAGYNLALSVRADKKLNHRFLIGAYVHTRSIANMVLSNQVSVVVERNLEGLVRKAVQVAIDRASGKAVPERVEVEMTVRRAPNLVVPAPAKP